MEPFYHNPRCFACFKKLEKAKLFKGPSMSKAVEEHRYVLEEINDIQIKISFCNEDCQKSGSAELRKCYEHLKSLKKKMSKMETKMPDNFPKRFGTHSSIYVHGNDGVCYHGFEAFACREFHHVCDEGESEESSCYDSSDEEEALELEEKKAARNFEKQQFIPLIKKKQSYAFTIGFIADRTNNKELYELHLELITDILRTTSYGFCEMFVSLLVTLLNLDRVNEAYKMILFRFYHNMDSRKYPVEFWKNFGPPNWFENCSEGKLNL